MSKYNFDLDIYTRNSLSIIIGMIKDGSKILEFGPAHGRLTKYLNEQKKCAVDIVELDNESGEEAKKYARKSLIGESIGNIENYHWVEILREERYDYIIFADVLEHLYWPEEVLKNAKLLLKDNGAILISIPNIAHNSVIVDLINDKFTYTEVGLLDSTHIRFFTYFSLKDMIEKCGLVTVIEDATYEEMNNSFSSPSYNEVGDMYLEDKLKKRIRGNVFQFVFKLQKKEYYQEQIPLVSINIDGRMQNEVVLYFKSTEDYEYREEKTKRKKIQNGLVIMEVDFSDLKDITSIRFDPSVGKSVIKINQLYLKKEDGAFSSQYSLNSNALMEEKDYYWFDNEDPQIEVVFNSGEYSSIFINYEVHNVYDRKLVDSLFSLIKGEGNLLEEINAKEIQNQELTKEISLKDEERSRMFEEINAKEIQNQELTKEISLKDEERSRMFEEINTKEMQNQELIKEIELRNKEHSKLLKEINIKEIQNDKILEEYNLQEGEIRKLREQINIQEIQRQKLQEEILIQKKILRDIYDSRGWKYLTNIKKIFGK